MTFATIIGAKHKTKAKNITAIIFVSFRSFLIFLLRLLQHRVGCRTTLNQITEYETTIVMHGMKKANRKRNFLGDCPLCDRIVHEKVF